MELSVKVLGVKISTKTLIRLQQEAKEKQVKFSNYLSNFTKELKNAN